jgi:polyisoprenoid-binding protein YceI
MAVSGMAQARPIDTGNSRLSVHAYRSGLFAFAAHDHEIAAPIDSGSIADRGALTVNFTVKVAAMRVLDPKASDDDRAQIQREMLGIKVLDAAHFPEIRFQSTTVRADSPEHWTVYGDLYLHGEIHPVTVQARRENARYLGEVTIKQKDFGIEPISIAGGTIKVKDEVKIAFSFATK